MRPDALADFGFPIRESHYHHGNPSQPRFGQRFRKNILVGHKVEQKIILVIRELREQGFKSFVPLTAANYRVFYDNSNIANWVLKCVYNDVAAGMVRWV